MKANAYRMLKRKMIEALLIFITLKIFIINFKVKRWGCLTIGVFPR